ncbi:MAG: glycosyltransferase [Pseudomonadota bacterium]|nr:glycosyltransferase [Pseudomonadota bacterium]
MPIYFLCPEQKTPVGGIRIIYRHVDILNKSGIPAYIVHKTNGFRVSWFENNTPIVYWRNGVADRLVNKIKRRLNADYIVELPISGGPASRIGAGDILVIPENYGPDLAVAYGRGIKKVVLNQNCYLTFHGYSFQRDRLITPYQHHDVLATMINSVDGEAYLKHVFPEMPLHLFRLSIDPQRFFFQAKKKKQICFSRIKNQADAMQVINILKFRGVLKGFDIVPFINMPQTEVASIYRDSLLFLSFGYPEGFGLPPAEAMACGCVAIGFHGGGGREFFRPEFSYPIEQGDIIGFARTVEEVIKSYEQNPATVLEKGRLAADFIREHYSPAREEAEVGAAWRAILRDLDKTALDK